MGRKWTNSKGRNTNVDRQEAQSLRRLERELGIGQSRKRRRQNNRRNNK